MWEVVGASVSRGKVFGRRALRADRGAPLPVTDVAKDEGSGIEAMFAHDPVSLTQRTTGPIVASDRLVPTVRTREVVGGRHIAHRLEAEQIRFDRQDVTARQKCVGGIGKGRI